jgi:hypothetical protein
MLEPYHHSHDVVSMGLIWFRADPPWEAKNQSEEVLIKVPKPRYVIRGQFDEVGAKKYINRDTGNFSATSPQQNSWMEIDVQSVE